MKTLEEVLLHTRVDPVTGCRIWLGCVLTGGYGQVRWQGRYYLVHRLVWELTTGGSPGALEVLHSCDIRSCCEFLHLFLGTQLDNVHDCIAKGRKALGERDGSHKLTDVQVAEIKRLLVAGEAQVQIAAVYCVHPSTISWIARNVRWKQVPWPKGGRANGSSTTTPYR